jgi:hypothetical protein
LPLLLLVRKDKLLRLLPPCLLRVRVRVLLDEGGSSLSTAASRCTTSSLQHNMRHSLSRFSLAMG